VRPYNSFNSGVRWVDLVAAADGELTAASTRVVGRRGSSSTTWTGSRRQRSSSPRPPAAGVAYVCWRSARALCSLTGERGRHRRCARAPAGRDDAALLFTHAARAGMRAAIVLDHQSIGDRSVRRFVHRSAHASDQWRSAGRSYVPVAVAGPRSRQIQHPLALTRTRETMRSGNAPKLFDGVSHASSSDHGEAPLSRGSVDTGTGAPQSGAELV
jgi:hypothetical protein